MRLIATDVDGTIVSPDCPVTERTAAAFAAAHAAGVRTAVVTGRPLRWLAGVVDDLGWVDAVVAANGALVLLCPGGRLDGNEQLIEQHTIPADDVVDWAVRLRSAAPGVAFGVERPGGLGAEPGYGATGGDGVTLGSLPDLLRQDPAVIKLLARVPDAGLLTILYGERPGDRLLALARQALTGRVEPVHSNSAKALVEMGPVGVDKGTGLARAAQSLAVAAADVVAFGDMPNDVSMLTWAGLGIAMRDGHPEALAAADRVAEPCAADGVAREVERLLAGAVA